MGLVLIKLSTHRNSCTVFALNVCFLHVTYVETDVL